MNITLIYIGSGIYVFLGILHGIVTLLELKREGGLSPVNSELRTRMKSEPLRLHSTSIFWNAWIAFNLTQSIGLIISGALISLLLFNVEIIVSNIYFISLVLSGSFLYAASAFFFLSSRPTIAIGAPFVLFLISFLLH
ncbi:LIC_13387 family protein [Aquimarina aquimarini]|uniref:LIC_13387 family protein n=1 Tax=Aquimarina aquimarini TaxID=1191734 RepID=UPI000D555C36